MEVRPEILDLDLDLLIVLRYDLLLRLPGSPVAALAISCMLTVPKKKMYSKKKRTQDANVCRERTEIKMYMLVLHCFVFERYMFTEKTIKK